MPNHPPTVDPDGAGRVITQGRALVRAIEDPETIEPSAWLERFLAHVLRAPYKRRPRAIVGAATTWMGDRILGASADIPELYGSLTGKN